jgi:hypothetical protein
VEEVRINQSKKRESFECPAIQSLLPGFENEIKKKFSSEAQLLRNRNHRKRY